MTTNAKMEDDHEKQQWQLQQPGTGQCVCAGTGHTWCLIALPFFPSGIRKVKEVQGRLWSSASLVRAMFMLPSINKIFLRASFICFKDLFIYIYLHRCFAFMYVCGWCLQRSEEYIGSPVTGLQMIWGCHVVAGDRI